MFFFAVHLNFKDVCSFQCFKNSFLNHLPHCLLLLLFQNLDRTSSGKKYIMYGTSLVLVAIFLNTKKTTSVQYKLFFCLHLKFNTFFLAIFFLFHNIYHIYLFYIPTCCYLLADVTLFDDIYFIYCFFFLCVCYNISFSINNA